ncbi:MAG: protease complex subunit PrcB family protein [Deltaproteobacteria bacterium]|nr:protease complex subunit PrcB family protein [Deltaproteobacteria bacterium]
MREFAHFPRCSARENEWHEHCQAPTGMKPINQLSKQLVLLVSAAASLSLSACAVESEDVLSEEIVSSGDNEAKADHADIAFTEFSDDTSSAPGSEARKLFTTAAQYRAYFGHPAPAGVNWRSDWVVYYSAGGQNTGGYDASISNITVTHSGVTLKVTTTLESPGPGCPVTMAFSRPDVLVKFKRPTRRPRNVRFYKDDTVRDCNQPKGPFCGGIAGFPCPGLGTCVDDPTDDCDPRRGGADCGGVCECTALAKCVEGHFWDSSPEVCACVPLPDPCATVRCMSGTHCEVVDGNAQCIPDFVTCEYDSKKYKAGDSFPAGDGCNACTCRTNGTVICTMRACPACNYDDPNKKYNGRSVDECSRIRFFCIQGTTYFSDACGCGCEQPADCPPVIDCEPPTDCSAERLRCPFSKVAL